MPGPSSEETPLPPPAAGTPSTPVGENPFIGPVPFLPGRRLYGRTREETELYHRLKARRIVVLHSPSGAGKTSLVNACLIPRLRENGFDVWGTIRVNTDPREHEGVDAKVNRYLLSALLSLEQERNASERRKPAELASLDLEEYIQSRPRPGMEGRPIVLLFDQFEEILTVAPREVAQKRDFFAAVGKALAPTFSVGAGPIWALFILREDYLGALAPYRERIPTQMSNTFRIDRLDLQQARDAATLLARDAGREFPGVKKLVDELSKEQVPQPDGSLKPEPGLHVEPVQLQVVCRRLWDAISPEKRTIDDEDVKRHAQVSKALAAYYAGEVHKIAEAAVPEPPAAAGPPTLQMKQAIVKRQEEVRRIERAVREWIGAKLIVGHMRNQVRQYSPAAAGLDDALIGKLVNCYLVRTESRGMAIWLELSHDRMVEPVESNNAAWEKKNLHWVQVQARQWREAQFAERLLLRSGDLREAEAWEETVGPLPAESDEKKLLEKSRVLRSAERKRVLLAVLFGVGIFAVAVAMGWLWLRARDEKANAEITARLAKAAEQFAEDAKKGAEEAAATALSEKKNARHAEGEAQRDKVAAVDAEAEAEFALEDAERAKDTADAARLAARESELLARAEELLARGEPRLAYLLVRDALEQRRKAVKYQDLEARILKKGVAKSTLLHDYAVSSASWDPSGTRIVTASRGDVRLWNADQSGSPQRLDGVAAIQSVTWSPEGDRVLLVGRDSNVAWVWNIGAKRPLVPMEGHTAPVTFAVWSPKGNRILTGSKDSTARLWKADGSPDGDALEGHRGTVTCGAFSPDEGRVVTGSWDKKALVWDLGKKPVTGVPLPGTHQSGVTSARFSSDGELVLTTWENGKSVRVFRPAAGQEGKPLEGHEGVVVAAVWSPEGKRIATASKDGRARVFGLTNLQSPKSQHVFSGHREALLRVAWSPKGDRLLTTSEGGSTRVWNANEPGEFVTLLVDGAPADLAAWSPKGDRILTTHKGAVKVWNAADLDVGAAGIPLVHDDDVSKALWSPDGKWIVTADDSDRIRLWDPLSTDKPSKTLREVGLPMAWSPRPGDPHLLVRLGGSIAVWDIQSSEPALPKGHPASWASWSPDGAAILAVVKGQAQLWNADGSPRTPRVKYGDGVRVARFSLDGKQVLTASDDGVHVWDLDGKPRRWKDRGSEGDIVLAQPRITGVWCNGDNKHVVTATYEGKIQGWNIDGTKEPKATEIKDIKESRPSDGSLKRSGVVLTLSPDGTSLELRNAEGALEGAPMPHKCRVGVAAWSPDGTRVVTGCDNGEVRMWRIGASVASTLLGKHDRTVTGVSFKPDGTAVVSTAAFETKAKIWRFANPDLKEPVRDCLDAKERAELLGEDAATARGSSDCQKSSAATPP